MEAVCVCLCYALVKVALWDEAGYRIGGWYENRGIGATVDKAC